MKREFARQLRLNCSKAEKLLWHFLRSKQMNGVKFRRQHIVGPYIVDFVALTPRLIIEVDGGQHMERTSYDIQRTLWLKLQGYRVLRFWNNEVLGNIEGVLEVVAKNLQGESINNPTLPSPM